MKPRGTTLRRLARIHGISAIVLLLPTIAFAQYLGGRAPGDSGLQAGSQPDPGVYLSMMHLRYDSDTLRNRDGDSIRRPAGSASVAVNAFTFGITYVSSVTILGANPGLMVFCGLTAGIGLVASRECTRPDDGIAPRGGCIPLPPGVRPAAAAVAPLPLGRAPAAVFEIDVLHCPDCGARMRILSVITEPRVARGILECLQLPARAPPLAPAALSEPLFDSAENPWFAEAETFHFDPAPKEDWQDGA